MTGKTRRKAKALRAKRAAKAAPKRGVPAKTKPAARAPAPAAGDWAAALVAANAQALGLPLDPAWHDGVVFNLRLILRQAALVDGFALPDDTEPAPVFHA
jgi:Protein of unknown function (DUF4089)